MNIMLAMDVKVNGALLHFFSWPHQLGLAFPAHRALALTYLRDTILVHWDPALEIDRKSDFYICKEGMNSKKKENKN